MPVLHRNRNDRSGSKPEWPLTAEPADLLVLMDGSMLISDDFNGAAYRVTYDGASVAR